MWAFPNICEWCTASVCVGLAKDAESNGRMVGCLSSTTKIPSPTEERTHIRIWNVYVSSAMHGGT